MTDEPTRSTGRRHLAARWYRTGAETGLSRIECKASDCDFVLNVPVGMRRADAETAFRTHRVTMGETVKPLAPSKLELVERENRKLRKLLATWGGKTYVDAAQLLLMTDRSVYAYLSPDAAWAKAGELLAQHGRAVLRERYPSRWVDDPPTDEMTDQEGTDDDR